MDYKKEAKELVDKFETYAILWAGGKSAAKQCALICCERIISVLNDIEDTSIFINGEWNDMLDVQYKIKEEIEKM